MRNWLPVITVGLSPTKGDLADHVRDAAWRVMRQLS